MPREVTLVRIEQERNGVTGITLAATIGLGVGVMAGMVLGEMLGAVHSERVRGAVGRLRPAKSARARAAETARTLTTLESAIAEAIANGTEGVEVTVHALGNGIIELTGSAPEAAARQLAGKIAQQVPGADVVVNRILVADDDGATDPSTPTAG